MTTRAFPWRLFLSMTSFCVVFYAVCMRYPQGPRSANSRFLLHRTPTPAEFGASIVAMREYLRPGARAVLCIDVEAQAHGYKSGVGWLVSRRLLATAADGTIRELWHGGMLPGPANPEIDEHIGQPGPYRTESCCFDLHAVPAAYGPIVYHWDAAASPAAEPGSRDVSLADLNRASTDSVHFSRALVLRR